MKFLKLISIASLLTVAVGALQASVTVRSTSDSSPTVTIAGSISPVTAGMNLVEGLLETNTATVVIVTENGSVLTLAPDSALVIDGIRGTTPVANLLRGQVVGNIVGSLTVTTAGGQVSAASGAVAVATDGRGVQVSNAGATVTVTPPGAVAPTPVAVGQISTVAPQGAVLSVSLSPQAAQAISQGNVPSTAPLETGTTPTTGGAIGIPDHVLDDVEKASDIG